MPQTSLRAPDKDRVPQRKPRNRQLINLVNTSPVSKLPWEHGMATVVSVSDVSVSVNERIPFRLLQMPCCGYRLCWVTPRLPNHCPACGRHVLLDLKSGEYTRISDDDAWIKYKS